MGWTITTSSSIFTGEEQFLLQITITLVWHLFTQLSSWGTGGFSLANYVYRWHCDPDVTSSLIGHCFLAGPARAVEHISKGSPGETLALAGNCQGNCQGNCHSHAEFATLIVFSRWKMMEVYQMHSRDFKSTDDIWQGGPFAMLDWGAWNPCLLHLSAAGAELTHL